MLFKSYTMTQTDLFGIDTKSGADFSEDRKYRYSLWRTWDEKLPTVMFIGLNPSTANEKENDPTIRSVHRISKSNGFGGFYMMNCWAYIATDPSLLMINPMSEEWNNNMLTVIGSKCDTIIFAWGTFSIVPDLGRDVELSKMFPNAKCLIKNKNGSPRHPLYVPSNTKLTEW